MNTCSETGCSGNVIARGWCTKHYQRWSKYGSPSTILTSHGMSVGWRIDRLTDRGGPDGCWEWAGGRNTAGYGLIKINGRTMHVTRYVLGVKIGRPLLPGELALHSCDNPPCVNPNHLFVGSTKDNYDDMIAKGRQRFPGTGSPKRGEAHPKTTLTDDSVISIRERFASGEARAVLARDFGVTWSTIDRIVKRQVWTHI